MLIKYAEVVYWWTVLNWLVLFHSSRWFIWLTFLINWSIKYEWVREYCTVHKRKCILHVTALVFFLLLLVQTRTLTWNFNKKNQNCFIIIYRVRYFLKCPKMTKTMSQKNCKLCRKFFNQFNSKKNTTDFKSTSKVILHPCFFYQNLP